MDLRRSSQQARDSLEESQCKVVKGRMTLSETQIDLERERYRGCCASSFQYFYNDGVNLSFVFIRLKKKRIEEELEVLKRKAGRLQAQTEGSSIVEKLQQELGEYREILKCDICLDRTKQVLIESISVIYCLIHSS